MAELNCKITDVANLRDKADLSVSLGEGETKVVFKDDAREYSLSMERSYLGTGLVEFRMSVHSNADNTNEGITLHVEALPPQIEMVVQKPWEIFSCFNFR
ncbi:MAG: hypothetical protein EOP11_22515 [Proteobacteria bacterium]|nr:MAG: hypothetical protein EOP11_22515 [Pseudomonadota bacterium]